MIADPAIRAIAARILALTAPAGPVIVGVTGSVAAGKSVFAGALAEALTEAGRRVDLVATDGFLRRNADLDAAGLASEKGFPVSYDTAALKAALEAIRRGPAVFPGYSHTTYDVEPALARTIEPPDILIMEGLNLAHDARGAPRLVDCLIYLDAEEADLEAWFVARFMGLWAAAEHDPASFYTRFRAMTPEAAEAFARMVWTSINLRNLRDHIIHARAQADIIVRKGPDHGIVAVEG